MENDVNSGQAFPKCPRCGEEMGLRLRTVGPGIEASYICICCRVSSYKVRGKHVTEDIPDAARLLANNGFFDVGPVITNGDKLREFANMPDDVLAQRLLEIDDIAEEIPFCKELPECQELAEGTEPIPADKCLQCLINWLGQPAEESEQNGE